MMDTAFVYCNNPSDSHCMLLSSLFLNVYVFVVEWDEDSCSSSFPVGGSSLLLHKTVFDSIFICTGP